MNKGMGEKFLKDYKEPNYWVDEVKLTFNVLDDAKKVFVETVAIYNKNRSSDSNCLKLNGEAALESIKVDGKLLVNEQFVLENNLLILTNLPDQFELTINTVLYPWHNKSCMGLYESRGNLITQCEAEGFRKITYYQDRPDVMAKFTVKIIANRFKFNSLLSNGNFLSISESGDLSTAIWSDPHKKPSYLFALVVGNLSHIEDVFTTKSGRNVILQIYSEPKYIDNLGYAMGCIKDAMTWDEERFNLEYDLERYMIVATSDFNMGAMENKGLNIFNAKYILSSQDISTDTDFIHIQSVIGHEYFHNWTGNRVTCKNWFQLSLKEGLTVFRDQEFTADLHDPSVKRIRDVKLLKRLQFSEDASPLAHPVRPESYVAIDNFYTVTVYEKGAEIVRMYQTILGKEGFKNGLRLYFKRHDGTAVTCDDFCNAMADANNVDLQQFMLWYSQAGTPYVSVKDSYNPVTFEYSLEFTQKIADVDDHYHKKPYLIPIKIGLLDNNGHDLINLEVVEGKYIKQADSIVLLIDDINNKFTFKSQNLSFKPIPSLLREFSAPIRLEYNYSESQRILMINNDSDKYNRFEHLQQVFINQIKSVYNAFRLGDKPRISKNFNYALGNFIMNSNLSPDFRSLAFTMPDFEEMLIEINNINPIFLAQSIMFVEEEIGESLFDIFVELYNLNLSKKYLFEDHGKRALKNTALYYIVRALNRKINNNHSLQLLETIALGQFYNSDNMTDTMAVLYAVNDTNNEIRELIFREFYQKWNTNELIMDKWFSLQAMSKLVNINVLNKLLVDKAFIATNPNKIYSLLNTFTSNGKCFNTEDGYSFIADQVIAIDKFNPGVAGSLACGFSQASSMQENFRKMAKSSIQRILSQEIISNNVFEVSNKIVNSLN